MFTQILNFWMTNMGELAEIHRYYNAVVKKRREKRSAYYEPLLEQLGAEYKAQGIYEYKGWFCYPSKGYAMLRKNNRIRKPLRLLLQGVKKCQ